MLNIPVRSRAGHLHERDDHLLLPARRLVSISLSLSYYTLRCNSESLHSASTSVSLVLCRHALTSMIMKSVSDSTMDTFMYTVIGVLASIYFVIHFVLIGWFIYKVNNFLSLLVDTYLFSGAIDIYVGCLAYLKAKLHSIHLLVIFNCSYGVIISTDFVRFSLAMPYGIGLKLHYQSDSIIN